MFKINLVGEIGWSIYTSMVDDQLKEANGQDLDVYLSSPGGSVFEGVEIFQLFSQYKRDFPKSQMILNMGALSASMGSYNSANKVFDIVTVQSNTSWMEHNPLMGAYGDFQEMKKAADFLERMAAMMAPVYAGKSGNSIEVERDQMNNETWLFGQEIIDAGYADEMLAEVPEGQSKEKAVAIAQAELKYKAVMKKVRESEIKEEDFNRVAAILKVEPKQPSIQPATSGENNMEDQVENEKELKEKFPEVHSATMKAGEEKVMEEMKANNKAIMEFKAQKEYKDIPVIQERCDEAIAKCESFADMKLAITAMLMNPSISKTVESPPAISQVDPNVTMSGEHQTDDEKKIAADGEKSNGEW